MQFTFTGSDGFMLPAQSPTTRKATSRTSASACSRWINPKRRTDHADHRALHFAVDDHQHWHSRLRQQRRSRSTSSSRSASANGSGLNQANPLAVEELHRPRSAGTRTSTFPACSPTTSAALIAFDQDQGHPHPRRRHRQTCWSARRRPMAGSARSTPRPTASRSSPGRLCRPGQPDAAGYPVTPATGDLLRVTNSSGADAARSRSRSSALNLAA
jgi:hypothetical protein